MSTEDTTIAKPSTIRAHTARQQAGMKPRHGNTGRHHNGVSGNVSPRNHPTVASGGVVPLKPNPNHPVKPHAN